MLGDPMAHSGYQSVYGWYCQRTVCAKILLWLMGLIERLDCQPSVSPHFSSHVWKVPPVPHCYTQPFCSAVICQWWLSPLEYRGARQCQLGRAFLTNLFWPTQKSLDNVFLIFFFSVTLLSAVDVLSDHDLDSHQKNNLSLNFVEFSN